MPPSPPDHRSPLLPSLRADQSERWQKGDRVRVEQYLAQYPDLASDPDALLHLILAEALLRGEHGDPPTLDEYLARFPGQAAGLRRRWGQVPLLPQQPRSAEATASDLRTAPRQEPAAPALPSLPGFEVLAEVGHGGMGVVYRARDTHLDRAVAIKLIRTGPLAGQEELARFRTEAKAVARLRHPGVVQVHGFGEHAGSLYLVMEYLGGGSLSARLRRGPLPLRDAAALVRDVARGVQAAHQAQVVHRDLKPSNVLLDGGLAKVTDFGLARLLDAESDLTRSEAILGTPAYMAPEQAAGKVAEVGPLADVWALGAVLYECLAGRPAFQGETRTQTLERVKNGEPAPLRRSRADVPAELEAVCLRCLEKQPSRRYASAGELADDLERWLQGEPVRARPAGRLRKLGRWLRRRRWPVGAVAGCVGLALAAWLAREAGDPDRSLRRIERELGDDKAATLVAEGAAPRWSEWALGKATRTAHPDGSFRVESWTRSLLLLVRDPRLTRFRFRARIRHENGKNGRVGLAVGWHDYPLPGRVGQFYLPATFNDVEDEGARIVGALKAAPGARVPAVRPLNSVNLDAIFYVGRQPRDEDFKAYTCFMKRLFEVSRPGQRRWRSLEVEVRPETVRVVFEGQLAGEIAKARVLQKGAGAWKRLVRERPDLAGVPLPARYEPRGGLGLVVEESTASFDNVVVEGLDD